jgi:hypothetical protein
MISSRFLRKATGGQVIALLSRPVINAADSLDWPLQIEHCSAQPKKKSARPKTGHTYAYKLPVQGNRYGVGTGEDGRSQIFYG